MSFTRLLVVAALLLGLPLGVRAAPELRTQDGRFVDAQGRTVLLRGMNVAGNSKVPPFRPVGDPSFFAPLTQFRMNAIRFLFTWEAYEPQVGQYDNTYLDYYATAADWAFGQGLYVIVDFHQDAFSRFALQGCGEGFPEWALPPAATPAVPDNGADCADWGFRMLNDAGVRAAWENFYDPTSIAHIRYLMMVERVATRLAANPGVVGYDLLNEPAGDEPTQLGPLYEEAVAAIRRGSPDAIIFVSPVAITDVGGPTQLPRPGFDNFAYSPHYYDAGVSVTHDWTPGTSLSDPFHTVCTQAATWGVPLVLGEFGASASTGHAIDYLDEIYKQLDGCLASGMQWVFTPGWTQTAKDGWNTEDFSIVDDHGAVRANFRAQAYPRRVAGQPTRFSAPTGAPPAKDPVELDWVNDPAAGPPPATEIFVPTSLYGVSTLALSPKGAGLSCTQQGDLVTCQSAQAGAMSVTISAPAQDSGCSCNAASGGTGGGSTVWILAALALASARRRKRGRR